MEKSYIKAFSRALGCNKKDILIKRRYTASSNNAMIVLYNDKVYEVISITDIYFRAKEYLTTEIAFKIPASLLNKIVKNIHYDDEFHESLLLKLDNKDKLSYQKVFQKVNDGNSEFWSILENSDVSIYTKVVNIVAKILDLEGLKDLLVTEWIEHGHQLLSESKNGFFEEIMLDDIKSGDNYFFIYDIDIDFHSI